MVSTRSRGSAGGATNGADADAGNGTATKRSSAPTKAKQPAPKKSKTTPLDRAEKDGNATLTVDDDGEVGLDKSRGGDVAEEEQDEKEPGEGEGGAKREEGEEKEGFSDDKKYGKDMRVEDVVEGEGKQKGEEGVKEKKEDEAEKKTEEKEDRQNNEKGQTESDAGQGYGEGKGSKENQGEANITSARADKAKDRAAKEATPSGDEDKPKHGTLESGHIYFLYRPKIDADEVEGIDDVSKFHILLIPKTGRHAGGHYHRVIEVGKKKLPDPGAKRQVIWGLVGATGTDKSALKTAFGAYDYETKTRGTRHQSAARPAARGHYILHSPRDERADSPNHDVQRDYKTLLVYEITTPPPEDFGRVQEELGLEHKGAVGLSVKDPEGPTTGNNPRAANMPREKKAHYPSHLHYLFGGRRWIAPNPVTFLDYPGGELLFLSSAHSVAERLGKDGERVEADLDEHAEGEQVDVDGALKELGMSKGDTEIEALEGAWA